MQSFTNVGICCPTPGAGRSGTWTGVQKSEPASEETRSVGTPPALSPCNAISRIAKGLFESCFYLKIFLYLTVMKVHCNMHWMFELTKSCDEVY